MYKINFNHLYYFLTIANEGSIVKASKKLNMTQPALSHQLKLLELDLGKKLFDRKGKRLVINENGEQVKDYASSIFRQTEEMLITVKTKDVSYIKVIKVGLLPWIPTSHVYKLFKRLILSPNIQLQFIQQELDALLESLKNKKLDFILCDGPYSGRTKKYQGELINEEDIYAVINSGLKKISRNNSNIWSLVNYSGNCQMRDKIEKELKRRKIQFNIKAELSDITLMKKFVIHGKNIGFFPKSEIIEEIKTKKVRKLFTLEKEKHQSWLIYRIDNKLEGILSKLF